MRIFKQYHFLLFIFLISLIQCKNDKKQYDYLFSQNDKIYIPECYFDNNPLVKSHPLLKTMFLISDSSKYFEMKNDSTIFAYYESHKGNIYIENAFEFIIKYDVPDISVDELRKTNISITEFYLLNAYNSTYYNSTFTNDSSGIFKEFMIKDYLNDMKQDVWLNKNNVTSLDFRKELIASGDFIELKNHQLDKEWQDSLSTDDIVEKFLKINEHALVNEIFHILTAKSPIKDLIKDYEKLENSALYQKFRNRYFNQLSKELEIKISEYDSISADTIMQQF